ncbi:MAG: cell division topological specificity factor MinE [Lachnospiraceae bacterium]|nr:cell division topological specificity factor MinE [Lachnospiraceae bacterium]MDD3795218.1 cell division topological specificity factor MinE [Lachnospiraceae bacterium]
MGRYHVSKQMTSGGIAKIRLEQTLASDYLDCSTEQFQILQNEILEILSRYMNINNAKEIDLNIIHEIEQGVPYVKTIQIKRL